MELLLFLQPVMQANNSFSMMLCIRLCCICEGSIWPDGHAHYFNLHCQSACNSLMYMDKMLCSCSTADHTCDMIIRSRDLHWFNHDQVHDRHCAHSLSLDTVAMHSQHVEITDMVDYAEHQQSLCSSSLPSLCRTMFSQITCASCSRTSVEDTPV